MGHRIFPHRTHPRARRAFGAIVCACGLAVALASTTACTPNVVENVSDIAPQEQHYTPGTYTGTGLGNGGDIVVEVTFSESAIESIEVVDQAETAVVASQALELLPETIVKEQSLGIDAVSGASLASFGLINAVADAAEQAGGNVDALKQPLQKEMSEEVVDLETGTVVVGGGAAGMSSALRLDELGEDVILVEKTYRLGGSISVSGGNQVVQGSALQAEAGVTDDSPESMIEDFQENGEGICVDELISLFSHHIGEATDWLNQYVGVEYNMEGGLHTLAEYSHNRELAYEGGGAGAATTMIEKLESTDVDIMLNTEAESLIAENGAVKGIVAEGADGTTYNIHADHVILATGGYGHSSEWLTDDLKNNALYYGLFSSTGDGLTMATAEGVDAATRMIEYAKQYPNGVEVSKGRAKSTIDGNLVVWPMSAILVNPEGERVVNEHASNHEILEVELAQTDSMLYLLMDAENWEAWSEKLPDTGFNMQAVEGYLEANGSSTPVFAHADTLAELAELVGIDPAVLEQTVADYNAGVEAGQDEFGRSGQYLQKTIGEGPYYLVEQKPRYCTTMGGLVVDETLQVENTSGALIEGLYAAGEVVGGVMGSNSPSGANNAWAITSGKLVAETIVG